MIIAQLSRITTSVFSFLDKLQPLWWLMVRCWIAAIFFQSGLVKLDDMETTIALFADEYRVPFLPADWAAFSATAFELVCPVLLVLGLGTRAAAVPLLVMTAVIQFTYLPHVQHEAWALLLLGLILSGAGCWSVDGWLRRRTA